MKRFHQTLLIGTSLPLCWLMMMAVHELGHVSAAVATGGTVARVVLHPLAISRTDLSVNPNPAIVAWAGAIVGVLLPILTLAVFRVARLPGVFLMRFFAGFCLVANGVYLGIGSFDRVGDAGDLLRHGTPIGCLWLFGVLTAPVGLYLWHGLGPDFGLGSAHGNVEHGTAYVSAGLLAMTLILMTVC